MLHDKREFALGLALLIGFFAVLAILFQPLLPGGRNIIDYLDGVFNSISKHSAYFIPQLRSRLAASPQAAPLHLELPAEVARPYLLGFTPAQTGAANVTLALDLKALLSQALDDADHLFRNDGAALQARHGQAARQVGHDWHRLLSAVAKALERQDRFAEGKQVRDVLTRAIEPAYNYYGIEAVPMRELAWVVFAALVGYVLYTVWYGFAILYLFEGWGLKLEH